jgi:hypothetical protein
LQNDWKLYNHHIPQRAIDGKAEWLRPEIRELLAHCWDRILCPVRGKEAIAL